MQAAQYNYLYTDYLGTPQIALNNQGQQTWKGTSEAFGKVILNTNNTIIMNLRFPGQYFDIETNTHYNGFRNYNPTTSRYIQRDPLGLNAGINLYAYTYNNPLRYNDPYGLLSMDTIFGFIHNNTGREPSDNFVNGAAGFGDGILSTMSFGLISGNRIRKWSDIGNVDTCSSNYTKGR